MTPTECETRAVGVSRLIRPDNMDTFLHDVWARAVRLYPHSLGDAAGRILDLDEFERMVGTLNRAHEGWIHFARGGLRPVPGSMVDADGMVDLRKIRAAFAGGETLYLTKAERISPSLMAMCRTVELELVERGVRLRQPVNAHVFLSPPGSQGFPPHRDEHASFVLQLEGSKEWTVYETAGTDTAGERLQPGGVDPSSFNDAVRHFFQLQAGDVLYMPAWWPHEARASSQYSLHVTVRLFPLRWVDIMSDICSIHPALSGVIPHEMPTTSADVLDGLVGVLNAPGFVEPLPGLIEEALRRYAVPLTALPGEGLRQLLRVDEIRSDTLLRRTDGTPCVVFQEGEAACIRFPGGVIRGPVQVMDVFDYVARTMTLRPRDLPAIPGTEYDRIDVAKRLVRDGLMQIADDAAAVETDLRTRVPATRSGGVI